MSARQLPTLRPGAPAPIWRAFACLAAALLFSVQEIPASARQQDAPKRPAAQPPVEVDEEEVIKIDTDLVLVEVSVTDAQGRPVRGLKAEDFKLYDDGEQREIAFVNVGRRGGAERPVAVVFAVDVSGSMTPEEMAKLQTAVRAFADRLSGRTALFALMSFGMRSKIHRSFTADRGKLTRALEELKKETNGLSTHTYDAVDDAVRLLVRQAPRTRDRRLMRRAVVVITDGFPVGDTVSPATVIERANEAEVSIYTVTLPSFSRLVASASPGRTPLPTPLDVSGLAERTGGANFYAVGDDYEPLFRALAEEVTSTYVLAFYPPEEKRRDGRSHALRVEGPRGLFVRQNRTEYKGNDR
jgi:Ca-activated chloride channel homolog